MIYYQNKYVNSLILCCLFEQQNNGNNFSKTKVTVELQHGTVTEEQRRNNQSKHN
jgi:3-isopropylmalate dehydratase small subunit